MQHTKDELAILGLQLLGDGCDLLHAQAPVVELGSRARVGAGGAVAALQGFLEICLDLSAPVAEQRLKLRDYVGVLADLLVVLIPALGAHSVRDRLQRDAVVHGADRVLELADELAEALLELLRLLLRARAPLCVGLDEGQEDLLETAGEGFEDASGHLSHEQIVVGGDLELDGSARGDGAHEIDCFAFDGLNLAGADDDLWLAAVDDFVSLEDVRGLVPHNACCIRK